jgi:hypothetical protein
VSEEISQPLRPGAWFWAAIVIGVIIRMYLVVFTQGTHDVGMWQEHATGVQNLGLIGYYHANVEMNHPPFVGVVFSLMLRAAEASGIPFRVLLRAPFALLDAGTALLLLNLLRDKRHRLAAVACYWLHPLAMIFSAYHGNTDSSVAFSLMLCLYLLSKGRVIGAGAALGTSLWIKLPAILAIPAFLFALPGWRKRLLFLAAIGIVGVSTYIPAFLKDPVIVYNRVFGYHGQVIRTTANIRAWGTQLFIVPFVEHLSPQWQARLARPAKFLLKQSWTISLALIVVLSWLRRSCKTTGQIGLTIAGAYTILYGFSNYWSFQYFSWSVPFWFFAPPVFLIGATYLAGGYIYLLYWLVCGNAWLLGKWDFVGHPYWPSVVIVFRNLAVLFFLVSACVFLGGAIYEQAFRRLKPMK